MSPAPKTGVGMRKMMFGFPPWPDRGFPAGRKLGWAMAQPAASLRPVMTKRLCTSPSPVPFGFRLKRASRMGPFCVMNHGTTFFAPLRVAIPIRGFRAGLDPPPAGCAWQDKHWFELKRGPSPLLLPPVTTSMSANLASPSEKNALSSAVRPCRGLPAPAAPPRTPGSLATFTDCASAPIHDVAKIMATNLPNASKTACCRDVMILPQTFARKLAPGIFDSSSSSFPRWAACGPLPPQSRCQEEWTNRGAPARALLWIQSPRWHPVRLAGVGRGAVRPKFAQVIHTAICRQGAIKLKETQLPGRSTVKAILEWCQEGFFAKSRPPAGGAVSAGGRRGPSITPSNVPSLDEKSGLSRSEGASLGSVFDSLASLVAQ